MRYEKGTFITVPKTSIIGIGVGPQSLYMWLCSYANTEGECYPARSTLAEVMGCTERTVDAYLDELIALGLVVKEARFSNNKQISNNYHLPLGVAIPARGVAKSAPTPSQNLRTELNPELTQSIYITADADFSQRKTYGETKGYDTKATSRLFVRSEELLGRRWPNRGKQLKAISQVLAAGYSEDRAWECFESLSSHQFWGSNGYDWSTVLSEIGKVKKKKIIKKLG